MQDRQKMWRREASSNRPLAVATDAGYSDDGWAHDTPLTDEGGITIEGGNLQYFQVICDVARQSGFDAEWCRVEGTANAYRVAVWDVPGDVFSAILAAASRVVADGLIAA